MKGFAVAYNDNNANDNIDDDDDYLAGQAVKWTRRETELLSDIV